MLGEGDDKKIARRETNQMELERRARTRNGNKTDRRPNRPLANLHKHLAIDATRLMFLLVSSLSCALVVFTSLGFSSSFTGHSMSVLLELSSLRFPLAMLAH